MGTKKPSVDEKLAQLEKGLENIATYLGNLANSQLTNSMVIDAIIESVAGLSELSDEDFMKDLEIRVKALMENRQKQIIEANEKENSVNEDIVPESPSQD